MTVLTLAFPTQHPVDLVRQSGLEPFGVEALPALYGFAGALSVLTVFTYPYVLLTVRSAVRRLDPSLEEVSRTLGRGRWTTFRRVVLPQLRPSIVAGSLLVALYTLSDFGAVSMLRFERFTRRSEERRVGKECVSTCR